MAIIPGTGAGAEQLTQFIERIERLEEEKRALMADIRDVYSEAKATGFEPKIMRQLVKMRAMDLIYQHGDSNQDFNVDVHHQWKQDVWGSPSQKFFHISSTDRPWSRVEVNVMMLMRVPEKLDFMTQPVIEELVKVLH